MHPAAYRAMQAMAQRLTIHKKHVLDVGSYNVNGSVRPLFADAASYHGIDTRAGRDVDAVADILTYTPEKPFDIVVSTEMLEHTADPQQTLAALCACVAPGGHLLLTCASAERAPHDSDGKPLRGTKEPYTPISADDLRGWVPAGWDADVTHDARAGDLYVFAKAPTKSQAKRIAATQDTEPDATDAE